MATQTRALAVRMVPLVREGVGDVTLITELALFDNHVVYARGLSPTCGGTEKVIKPFVLRECANLNNGVFI